MQAIFERDKCLKRIAALCVVFLHIANKSDKPIGVLRDSRASIDHEDVEVIQLIVLMPELRFESPD